MLVGVELWTGVATYASEYISAGVFLNTQMPAKIAAVNTSEA